MVALTAAGRPRDSRWGLMSYANRIVALVAGFTLFVVASKYAWSPTPDNYFEYCGKGVRVSILVSMCA